MSSSLTLELSPPALDQGRLTAALKALARWMEERYGMHVAVERTGAVAETRENEINEPIRMLVFQAARELLFNIVKHAQVDRAYLRLRQQTNGVELEVLDCGVGMLLKPDGHDGRHGLGLVSIRQRVEAYGGQLGIDGAAGLGTRIRLTVPLTPAPARLPETAPRPAASALSGDQAGQDTP